MPFAACECGGQAGVAQLVEHHVANVVVEGSSPFTRSFLFPGRSNPLFRVEPRVGGTPAAAAVPGSTCRRSAGKLMETIPGEG